MSEIFEKEIRDRCEEMPELLNEKISQLDLILGENSNMFDSMELVKRSNLVKVRNAIFLKKPFHDLTSCDIAEVHAILFS